MSKCSTAILTTIVHRVRYFYVFKEEEDCLSVLRWCGQEEAAARGAFGQLKVRPVTAHPIANIDVRKKKTETRKENFWRFSFVAEENVHNTVVIISVSLPDKPIVLIVCQNLCQCQSDVVIISVLLDPLLWNSWKGEMLSVRAARRCCSLWQFQGWEAHVCIQPGGHHRTFSSLIRMLKYLSCGAFMWELLIIVCWKALLMKQRRSQFLLWTALKT